jgi:hypothetical protein
MTTTALTAPPFGTHFLITFNVLGCAALFVSRKPVSFGAIALVALVAAAVAQLMDGDWGRRIDEHADHALSVLDARLPAALAHAQLFFERARTSAWRAAGWTTE